jgi:NADPH-dependent 7-cyano-7-deazaguanine reductase QueF
LIESKSLKLYLWGFREKGIFAEDLAATLLKDLVAACDQWRCVWILSSKCGANSRFGLLSAIQAVSRSASQPVSK